MRDLLSPIIYTQHVQPFGEAVMGEAGLAIFPILVAISAFGAAVLSTYVASRSVDERSSAQLSSHMSLYIPCVG